MKEIEYEGRLYRQMGVKWVDANNAIVPVALQKRLDRLTFEEIDLYTMSYEEAKAEGDRYKEAENYSMAISHYEQAIRVAENERRTSALLPRITSCYRKLHRPEKVIEILANAKRAYGQYILNEALLTSAAAAYCDMDQPENALRCCRHAYALQREQGKRTSLELHNVFARATHMIDPNGKQEWQDDN